MIKLENGGKCGQEIDVSEGSRPEIRGSKSEGKLLLTAEGKYLTRASRRLLAGAIGSD